MASSAPVLPDVDRSLVDNFERHVARAPDRVAVGDAVRDGRTVAQLAVEVLHAQVAQADPEALERALTAIAWRPDAAPL